MNHPRPIRCRTVEQHLPAYRAGEIHPALQRRIAYHLHHCDTCYNLYRRDLEIGRDVSQVLNTPHPVDFGHVWQGIKRDLNTPVTTTPPVRYALLVTALLLMLLVPMTFGRNGIAWATPPTPPAPRLQTAMLLAERATPSPIGAALQNQTRKDTAVSTPDASYPNDSLTVLSIMTP